MYELWLVTVLLQEIIDKVEFLTFWFRLVGWCVTSVVGTSVVLCLIVIIGSIKIASVVVGVEPTWWIVVSGLSCLILGRRLPVWGLRLFR